MVTPDAHRTMRTHLGASIELGPDDVDDALVRDSAVVYLEGYLWDPAGAREAMRKAIGIARDEGRAVALSLSDPFCIDRHRAGFLVGWTQGRNLHDCGRMGAVAAAEVFSHPGGSAGSRSTGAGGGASPELGRTPQPGAEPPSTARFAR